MGSLTELFLFQECSNEKSKQTLSLFTLFFMAQCLLLTPKDLSRHSWHTLFLVHLNHSPHTVIAKLLKLLKGPLKLQHNRNCTEIPPSPLTRNKLELWILHHQGRTQRNPPTSPPSITSLFFQAVTTCKAFPQAEHMGLINCRSLTTLSCPNNLKLPLSQPTALPFIIASTTFLLFYLHHFNKAAT